MSSNESGFWEPGPECGSSALVGITDRLKNQQLLSRTRTLHQVGEAAYLDGKHKVRITAVQPKGFICISASKSTITQANLPPVTNQCDIYRFEATGAGGPPSGQTTEAHLNKHPRALATPE